MPFLYSPQIPGKEEKEILCKCILMNAYNLLQKYY